ncbi:hypothetical protein NIASO_07550 [Niabella soli DSM 19437]|uniref:DUF4421 domain-containing protein n=1 Tax=Niabella soli DSM 19437 TaxID=929713 RepID=W0F316_9BACT|nr:hypothetical protein NIASO_07550 [Niabella soli DSM 19437]
MVTGVLGSRAQDTRDAAFVRRYEKGNVIEWNTGDYSSTFNFQGFAKHPSNFMLAANSNWYTGFFLNYKWVALQYNWGIPGTELDNKVKLKHTSFAFTYRRPKISINPFYDFYNGLLLQKRRRSRNFDAFRDMRYYTTGAKLMYYTNTGKFSYQAGSTFGEQQVRSAGGIIVTATPQWQRINWVSPNRSLIKDSLTYTLLSSDPQWVSLIAGAGYNYNFSIDKGKWIVSPAATISAGGLKEVNNHNLIQAVFSLQGWINAGYSGRNWYSYVNAHVQYQQTNLIIKKLNGYGDGVSVTAGYRFHSLPKKILGIL